MANHIKVKRKDTTDIATGRSASYIDIQLDIDGKGQFRTKLYGIPAAAAYGVYISQLLWYSRACGSYHDFFDKGLLLTRIASG